MFQQLKTLVINRYQEYSAGIDSFRMIIPEYTLNKFLKKIELFNKIKKTTKNKQIHQFVSDKFKSQFSPHKKRPFSVRYINLKRGVKSLSNTILILKNSKTSLEFSKKNKKPLNYYVEVVFAGFHQPSKDIEENSIKILKKFLKRFKVHTIDLAVDFDSLVEANARNKPLIAQASALFIEGNGKIKNAPSSLYVNSMKIDSKLLRLIYYDKYKKQKDYHKEDIRDDLKDWKRLETTIVVNKKFLDWVQTDELNNQIDNLTHITRGLGGCGLTGLNIGFLSKQIQKLKDLRRKIEFKAWALDSPKRKRLKIGA